MTKKILLVLVLGLIYLSATAQIDNEPQKRYTQSGIFEYVLPDLEDRRNEELLDSLEKVARAAEWKEWYGKNKETFRIPIGTRVNCTNDSLALVALYNATNGPNWRTPWNLNSPIRTWQGVSLSASGCVIELNLTNNKLAGTLPDEIGDLEALFVLQLGENQLSGTLPDTLANLTNLQTLHLMENQFSGTLPLWMGSLTNLEQVDLTYNTFSGSIPDTLCKLSNLETLNIGYNQLTGAIPTCLGNLTSLTSLVLGGNQLSGILPTTLMNLTNLTRLDLSNTGMTTFPTWLGTLTNLEVLYLRSNQLSGSIPTLLNNLTNLQRLSLYDNQLTGTIPTWVEDLSELILLDFAMNQLAGAIPTEIGMLPNLERLLLDNNLLDVMPDFTGQFLRLQSLNVSNNQFTFEDLLPNSEFFTAFLSVYAPQLNVGAVNVVDIDKGDNYTFSFPIDPSLTTNTYKWYRNGTLVATTTTPSFTLMPAELNDAGVYHVEVTNPTLGELTLKSEPITLMVELPTLPPNDQCVDAITLPVGSGSCSNPTVGFNVGATDSNNDAIPPPTANYPDYTMNDVWYQFTVPSSGVFGLDLKKGISEPYSFWFELYTGTCGDLTRIKAQNGTSWSFDYKENFNIAAPGETVFLRVWVGNAENTPGIFDVCVYERPCQQPSIGWNEIFACNNNTSYYVDVQVYDLGDANSLTISATGSGSRAATTSGNYRIGPFSVRSTTTITVAHQNALCNRTIVVDGPPSPGNVATNDEPCNASDLTPSFGAAYVYLQGDKNSTVRACEPMIAFGACKTVSKWATDAYNRSIWFSFEAPASGNVDMELTTGAGVAVWAASSCAGVYTSGDRSLVYAIDPCGDAPFLHSLTALTPGQTYYLQVIEIYDDFSIHLESVANSQSTICEVSDILLPTVTKNLYRIENTIASSAVLPSSNTEYTFVAGESITFSPGFHVTAGTELHAYIAPCTILATIVEETTPTPSRVQAQEKTTPSPSNLVLQVTPNPVQEAANIRFYLPTESTAKVRIFNLNGQLLTTQVVSNGSGWHTTRLDASQLPAGMYYVALQTATDSHTEKVMVVK